MPYKDPKIRREYMQNYNAINRERLAIHKKQYYKTNHELYPELYKERNRKYREKNREKIRELARKWKTKNKEKILQYRKNRVFGKGKFSYALCNSRRRAKEYGYQSCKATVKEIASVYTGKCHNLRCQISESQIGHKLHLDHNHETGKFRGWLCPKCNLSLGYAQDSIQILQGLVSYLQKEG